MQIYKLSLRSIFHLRTKFLKMMQHIFDLPKSGPQKILPMQQPTPPTPQRLLDFYACDKLKRAYLVGFL